MKVKQQVRSHLAVRTAVPGEGARRHRLPLCATTGFARYRDRHQARQGARAMLREPLPAGARPFEASPFPCPSCRGFHIERTYLRDPIRTDDLGLPSAAFTSSLGSRKRRYFLTDIENPTRGAKATAQEVAAFWSVLQRQAPGVGPRDHVVVAASRHVLRKYRAAIHGHNVRWIVGAPGPDGADRALLAAIDLRRVARDFDELVIVSGDGAFADLAVRAKAAGLCVHVVTVEQPEGRPTLSRRLAAAADVHTLVRLKSQSERRSSVVLAPKSGTAWLQARSGHVAAAA